MAIERTFSIIKPDAVAKNLIGKIYARFDEDRCISDAASLPGTGWRILCCAQGASFLQ